MSSNQDGIEERNVTRLYSVHAGDDMPAQFSVSSTKPELIALLKSLKRKQSLAEAELVYQRRLVAEKEAERKLLFEKFISQMKLRHDVENATKLVKYKTVIEVIEVYAKNIPKAKEFKTAVEKFFKSIH